MTGMTTSRRGAVTLGGALAAAAALSPGMAAPEAIWSAEYWAQKGDVRLYMYRKRLGAPKAGGPARPVLFLVHGSTNSSRSSFDLTVKGKGEYSTMNEFARLGYDVWTMDHEGWPLQPDRQHLGYRQRRRRSSGRHRRLAERDRPQPLPLHG